MIIERIRRPIENNMCITKGSTPVIYFGDYDSAKACTILLNPSNREFLYTNGEILTGNAERLCSRKTLGKNDGDSLTEEDAKMVLDYCKNYFTKNPFREWFDPFDLFIKEFGDYSYYKNTCVHLDLVQWATTPKWSDVPSEIRDEHMKNDLPVLKYLLEKNFEVVFLNGKTVVETFSDRLNIILNKKSTEYNINDNQEKQLHIYNGKYNKTKIVGWNFNLQNTIFGNENIKRFCNTIKSNI